MLFFRYISINMSINQEIRNRINWSSFILKMSCYFFCFILSLLLILLYVWFRNTHPMMINVFGPHCYELFSQTTRNMPLYYRNSWCQTTIISRQKKSISATKIKNNTKLLHWQSKMVKNKKQSFISFSHLKHTHTSIKFLTLIWEH